MLPVLHRHSDHPRVVVPDRVVKRLLVADLQEEPMTRGERISVEVRDGVAILRGIVGSAAARDAARLHARATAGVRDVSDQVTVAAPVARTARAS